MKIKVNPSVLKGEVLIPASKSHTIRAIAIATMAEGTSVLRYPLVSADALSCVDAARKMGAIVNINDHFTIKGINRKMSSASDFIDVGNSGTTLRIFTALAALGSTEVTFDGDKSIRQRLMQPLLEALSTLGAKVKSENGKCPFSICGPIQGGQVSIECLSSQFLTALLMAAPLASHDTEITVPVLNEQPYVEITLDWLKKQNIQFENEGLNWFKIKGNQSYRSFDMQIPADFSTATFALVAAAITKGEVLIKGLDFTDSQGDKVMFDHLKKMGAIISQQKDGVLVKTNELNGIDIDMNATPDALPAMAIVGCYAKGTTRLLNVPQARFKECDRIKASFTELSKMGANIEELPDGLIIHQSQLKGTNVHGYDDHRMVMSLAIAGLGASGDTIIDTAESAAVTYPGFVKDFKQLGANIIEFE
jgi:3-phosphoshikimate 1-carboxyvinyltransferase